MKILISGAGIAGLTAAIYLNSSAHEVTLIERSDGFKSQGYGLSIKSFGIEILQSLEVLDELKGNALSISAFNIYNSKGSLVRSIPEEIIEQMTGGAFPVARAHLHQVLYELVKQQIPLVWNKWITGVSHLSGKENITFNDGSCKEFDLVIIAEGLRSTTRELLCGKEGWESVDIKYAASLIQRVHNFQPGAAYTYKGVAKTISLFPVNKDQIVIQAYFRNTDEFCLDQHQIRKLLQDTYSGFAKEVREILKSLHQDDFVFYDSVAMIRLPQLAWNRVVLIGDAGYSTTFLSGMGASLSLLGAKQIAEALQTEPDIDHAIALFENQMLPITRRFQKYARDNMEKELPQKELKLIITNMITRIIPYSIMIKSVANKLRLQEIAPKY